jgi:hypothetical protein
MSTTLMPSAARPPAAASIRPRGPLIGDPDSATAAASRPSSAAGRAAACPSIRPTTCLAPIDDDDVASGLSSET